MPAAPVPPVRSGRAWRAGGSAASSKAAFDEDPDLAALEARLEEGTFLMAKPVRFRPGGCFVRLPGGQEAFLPVEHFSPSTEASTNAVRQAVNKLSRDGKLRVREIGSDQVSMLKAHEEALRGQELDARRRKMEEGIEKLRENYNPNKVMVGFVSSVQKNGIFVSVIDGLDALIPLKELPSKFLEEDGEVQKPTLAVGQAVQFRIIRYSWQSDGFVATMMPAERSRSGAGADRGRPRQEEEVERPPSPDRSEGAKVWASKGYSVVSSEAALELNQWLRSKMEDKKSKKGSKAVVKSTVTYLVSIARGMNTKAVGSLDLEKNVSEKEVKQAAVELLQKDGHLKAGEQHKGVTITKNIINVLDWPSLKL